MFEARIEQTEPMDVACLTKKGSYEQIPDGYATLYGWLTEKGLDPTGMPRAIYLTPPELPESEAIWELWAPVSGSPEEIPPDDMGLSIKHIEAHTIATTMHVGPYELVGPVYEKLMAWIAESGHVIVGPPQEVYFSDPAEVPPEEYQTQIMVPIAVVL